MPHLLDELAMVDIIKESLDVDIYHKIQVALLNHFIALCYCMFSRPIWSKAIASLVKFCFTDGLQYLQNTLLDSSIPHSWYAKWASSTVRFWNFNSFYSFRFIPLEFFLHNGYESILRDFF